LNSAVNRLRVFMVDHPSRHRIHLNHLSQKPGPPLTPLAHPVLLYVPPHEDRLDSLSSSPYQHGHLFAPKGHLHLGYLDKIPAARQTSN
jgi:hypothetical protein